MRYGTLPIVRDTGGLHDTVVDLDQHPEAGTGFVFQEFSSPALLKAFERVRRTFADAPTWTAAVQRSMEQDFSWDRSAQAYLNLYAKIQNHSTKT
jgi:starch synthase